MGGGKRRKRGAKGSQGVIYSVKRHSLILIASFSLFNMDE